MGNRKIDALVAEKVMGWKRWRFHNPSRIPGEVTFGYEAVVPPEYDGSDLQYLNMIIPPYSTDIAAAWKVWEWLENYYGKGKIALMENGVFLFEPEIYLAQAKTYEKAICLAALKAIGVEIEESNEPD